MADQGKLQSLPLTTNAVSSRRLPSIRLKHRAALLARKGSFANVGDWKIEQEKCRFLWMLSKTNSGRTPRLPYADRRDCCTPSHTRLTIVDVRAGGESADPIAQKSISARTARMKHWCSPILTKLQSAELLKC